ncbi:MAG: SPOR domain-containing protein [Bacteroidales bacterium]
MSTIQGRSVSNRDLPVAASPQGTVELKAEAPADTAGGVASEIPEIDIVEEKPIISVFTEQNPPDAEILVNGDLPEGLYYRIQVAAFRNPVKPGYFKSLGPVFGIRADNSDITYYFIGLFRLKSDADRALARVRKEGFSDAFILGST